MKITLLNAELLGLQEISAQDMKQKTGGYIIEYSFYFPELFYMKNSENSPEKKTAL